MCISLILAMRSFLFQDEMSRMVSYFFASYFFIDCYNLLRYDPTIQVHDINSTSCRLRMLNCSFECQCQCIWIMRAYTASPGVADDLRHIAYVSRDDWH